jgi:hypothetical protein
MRSKSSGRALKAVSILKQGDSAAALADNPPFPILRDPTEGPRLYVCGLPRLGEEFRLRYGSSGINL